MRIFIYCIAFCLVHLLYSNPFEYKNLHVNIVPDNYFYFMNGQGYYFGYPENSGSYGDYVFFTEDDIVLLDSGYKEIEFFDEKYYFVFGSGEAIMYYRQNKEFSSEQKIATTISLSPHIKSIIGSSCLSESYNGRSYEYKAENLIDIISYNHNAAFWPRNPIPWVEGVNGSGIGETLDIEFDRKHGNMVLLNGFIDFERVHLFKANNRVKRAKITSLEDDIEFEIIVDFKDEVCFTTIEFPEEIQKVCFEILEVYPGTEYNDTVISSILNIGNKTNREESNQRYESRMLVRKERIDSYNSGR